MSRQDCELRHDRESAASRPGAVACARRDTGARRAAAPRSLRLLRLRPGRSGSGMAKIYAPVAVRGWFAQAIPPAVDLGKPSRPPPGAPASVRAVKVRLTWRTGRRPGLLQGGPTADGMTLHSRVGGPGAKSRWFTRPVVSSGGARLPDRSPRSRIDSCAAARPAVGCPLRGCHQRNGLSHWASSRGLTSKGCTRTHGRAARR